MADQQEDAPRPSTSCLLLTHAALPVLLSHSCVAGSQTLIAMLQQTSRALSDVISEHLVGSVPITFSATGRHTLRLIPGLADWLARHGHIVEGCDVCMSVDVADCQLAERTLALGLLSAAASPRGLCMQSYEHHGGTASVKQVLRQLPAKHLTHLHLCFDDAATGIAAVAPALALLTNLSSLTIRSGTVDELLPAAGCMSRLTCLRASSVARVSSLAALPPSLLDVRLSCDEEEGEPEVLQLAHLTQCTSLHGTHLPLMAAGDQLPPALQQLGAYCGSNEALGALGRLTALTSLALHDPNVDSRPALEALAAGLTQLQHVELHYGDPVLFVGPWKLGWCGLPICVLHICVPPDAPDFLSVPEAAVAGLASVAGTLRDLACLGSAAYNCVIEASPAKLAASIRQLTGLKRLALSHVEFEHVLGDEDDAGLTLQQHMDCTVLYEAAAGLPRLDDLLLGLLPTDSSPRGCRHPATALAAGGACGALTRLSLHSGALNEFVGVSLALSLTGLASLDLDDNPQLGDATLAAIASGLPRLTSLSLQRTGVTSASVAWLSRLGKLQVLGLPTHVPHDDVIKALARFELAPDGMFYTAQ